jgi:hypothetical protein
LFNSIIENSTLRRIAQNQIKLDASKVSQKTKPTAINRKEKERATSLLRMVGRGISRARRASGVGITDR